MNTEETQSGYPKIAALRMRAIYHNCLASAAFAREDSLRAHADGNQSKSHAELYRAQALEQAAGWLDAAIKELN